jgi:cysteine desulfurase
MAAAGSIYLDHNATTPLAPEVLEVMLPYLQEHHGNPSSVHRHGRVARAAIDEARDRMARCFGVRPHEIIFTGGGTESDNLGVLGLALAAANRGQHIISCATEHHAVLEAVRHLEVKRGFHVTWLPVDRSGSISLEALEAAIRPETILVTLMTANNETGVRHPVSAIGNLCRSKGVLFHTDAIQSVGKEPLDLSFVDAASVAAHKFYGPKGVGALILRSGLTVESLVHGGAHENMRRPGTENTAAIIGMATAAERAVAECASLAARLAPLRERLWEGIGRVAPCAMRNTPVDGLCNTLNVSFPGFDGESLIISLDLERVSVSSGSACMVGSITPSHVLIAMGLPPETAQATVRFSLGRTTSEWEIDTTIDRLQKVFDRLKATE